MVKKVLFCANIDHHFNSFHLPYMKWFKEMGWEVHVAAKGNMDLPFVDKRYNMEIQRSPFALKNIKVYHELHSIIDKNKYEIIHCHTPMGGVLTRIASRKARENGTKVIYTAHGFHFCKGAPLINWLVYYPIEKMLAHVTDCLITINEEDYNLAVSNGFSATRIEHVHGVGVDTERFKPFDKDQKSEEREAFGYKPDDILMFYAAEFNKNKNQQFLIKAMSLIKDRVPHARLLLAGEGPLVESCKKLAIQMGVEHMIDFLGYRTDIASLLPICDFAVASSLREGLPVNIMEAMACGLPVIATENRGHSELIQNNQNGWIVNNNNAQEMAEKIIELVTEPSMISFLGEYGRELMQRKYSVRNVLDQKKDIYMRYILEMEGLQWAVQ